MELAALSELVGRVSENMRFPYYQVLGHSSLKFYEGLKMYGMQFRVNEQHFSPSSGHCLDTVYKTCWGIYRAG